MTSLQDTMSGNQEQNVAHDRGLYLDEVILQCDQSTSKNFEQELKQSEISVCRRAAAMASGSKEVDSLCASDCKIALLEDREILLLCEMYSRNYLNGQKVSKFEPLKSIRKYQVNGHAPPPERYIRRPRRDTTQSA